MRTTQERIHPCEGTHALADKQIHDDGFLPSSKPNEPQQSHNILNRGSRVEAHESFNFFNRGMEDSHGICGIISANQYSFHDYMNEEDRVFGYYVVEESQNLKPWFRDGEDAAASSCSAAANATASPSRRLQGDAKGLGAIDDQDAENVELFVP
ncbi:hypothetical protein KSP40_PGU016203 [Platanthera guangdongensis]|uniref:Uncharacterized protein n=1 Tax=Platanthera guangdongensis TaxID=2320717 RepID=A0ABR2LQA6_9ASPA